LLVGDPSSISFFGLEFGFGFGFGFGFDAGLRQENQNAKLI
jgi:hypothetical protein